MANPLTSLTDHGIVLTKSGSGYETYALLNACLLQDGDTMWVSYMAWPSYDGYLAGVGWEQTMFASLPLSSFPNTMTKTDTITPWATPTATAGSIDYLEWFPYSGQPHLMYDPVEGIYHEIFNTTRCRQETGCNVHNSGSVPLTNVGHATNTSMSGSGWTMANPEIISYDLFSAIHNRIDTQSVAPKAGGGWIYYLTGEVGIVWYHTASDLNVTPDTGVFIAEIGSTAQFINQFVYNGTYYILVNPSWPEHSAPELFYAETQTGPWTFECSLSTLFNTYTNRYVTGLAGYSLNSGSIYGINNTDGAWQSPSVRVFSLGASPISNPEPVLSQLYTSFDDFNLNVTGYVSLGNGNTDLWAVGLYNETRGTRAKATWSSWGENSPGTVANTFSGAIAAENGDTVTITAYNVGLESDSETIIVNDKRLNVDKGRSTINIV
jgi:hypothetical protein